MIAAMHVFNWKRIAEIEDGCGGIIYKIVDARNPEMNRIEMAMCVFSPGEVSRMHYHARMDELYFILDGAGEIEIDGSIELFGEEDCISIPRGKRHRITNKSENKQLRFLSINSPEWQDEDMIFVDS